MGLVVLILVFYFLVRGYYKLFEFLFFWGKGDDNEVMRIECV